MEIKWEPIEPGWYHAKGIGSIRNAASYKPGGWWFMSQNLPDLPEHDIGPFKTMTDAIRAALKQEGEYTAHDGEKI